jgi:hypothetical protein
MEGVSEQSDGIIFEPKEEEAGGKLHDLYTILDIREIK